MRAATIRDGKIVVAEHPDPVPGAGQVLVRVHAAGLNGADQAQLIGLYPPPPGSGVPDDIPGLELAGEVAGIGPGVTGFRVGDRVMALVAGAGQAELAVVNERQLMPVPESLDSPQDGAFPEVFSTAYDALFNQGRLQAGDHLLVHGAAGGVGTAAVQLAAAVGARVTATVRNPGARSAVAALGAHVIAPDDFISGGPYDVILELVGGPNIATDLQSLAVGGRIVVIGVGGGFSADLNLIDLVYRRASIVGTNLRTRSLEEKALLARQVERHVLPAVSAGRVHVPLAAAYPLDQVAEAYASFAAGGKIGKIVLTF
ncbi:zinc-binding dehydrogenase [Catenulispora pinisilvae]|uniref:zinc-binding dehydrogenase n=1 Tax=Catenulispora pinisilvae TaxID=2705253 RepID=UPI0018923328|nr:zinc-binding dehydrogenase [Catenulispora pinisilvae]